ncbi:MAG: DUF975 family protein [Roseburia sp.]|nr:DUF975 family protein [Roseburia sp.]
MGNYKSNADLKYLARMQMNGKMGVLILAMVIEYAISYFAAFLVSAIIPPVSPATAVLNYIVTFIVQLLAFVLQVGACLLHLHASCDMPCSISDLFYGFRNSPDKAIKIGAVLAVINAICMLPGDLIQGDMTRVLNTEITSYSQLTAVYSSLLSFYLVILLCMIVYFVATLAFFPVFYMVLDFPSYTAGTILRQSIRLMKGNKLRYVSLTLSFLPLIFLSVFTCGIALLWVIPYMEMTSANFYLDLVSQQKSNAPA